MSSPSKIAHFSPQHSAEPSATGAIRAAAGVNPKPEPGKAQRLHVNEKDCNDTSAATAFDSRVYNVYVGMGDQGRLMVSQVDRVKVRKEEPKMLKLAEEMITKKGEEKKEGAKDKWKGKAGEPREGDHLKKVTMVVEEEALFPRAEEKYEEEEDGEGYIGMGQVGTPEADSLFQKPQGKVRADSYIIARRPASSAPTELPSVKSQKLLSTGELIQRLWGPELRAESDNAGEASEFQLLIKDGDDATAFHVDITSAVDPASNPSPQPLLPETECYDSPLSEEADDVASQPTIIPMHTPSSGFTYTDLEDDDRQLYHEEWVTLEPKVRALFTAFDTRPTPWIINSITRIPGGAFNRIVCVSITDPNGPPGCANKEFILRISRYDLRHLDDRCIASIIKDAIAVPLYLERYRDTHPLKVPVPMIRGYDTKSSNLLGSPYVIMDRAPGTNMLIAWSCKMTHAQRLDMVGKFANVLKEIHRIQHTTTSTRCGKIGIRGRYRPGEEPFQLSPLDKKRYTYAPTVIPHEICEHLPNDPTYGRFAMTQLDFLIYRFRSWRATYVAPDIEDKSATHIRERTEVMEHIIKLNSIERIAREMDHFLFVFSSTEYALCHPDLFPRNMMTTYVPESDTYRISAILDWDGSYFAHPAVACTPPRWMWTPDNIESENVLHYELEDDDQEEKHMSEEHRQLKARLDEAMGSEWRRLAYGPIPRMIRMLWKIALDGVASGEATRMVQKLEKWWNVIKRGLLKEGIEAIAMRADARDIGAGNSDLWRELRKEWLWNDGSVRKPWVDKDGRYIPLDDEPLESVMEASDNEEQEEDLGDEELETDTESSDTDTLDEEGEEQIESTDDEMEGSDTDTDCSAPMATLATQNGNNASPATSSTPVDEAVEDDEDGANAPEEIEKPPVTAAPIPPPPSVPAVQPQQPDTVPSFPQPSSFFPAEPNFPASHPSTAPEALNSRGISKPKPISPSLAQLFSSPHPTKATFYPDSIFPAVKNQAELFLQQQGEEQEVLTADLVPCALMLLALAMMLELPQLLLVLTFGVLAAKSAIQGRK